MKKDRRLLAMVVVALALVQVTAFAAPSRTPGYRLMPTQGKQGGGKAYEPGRLVVGLRHNSAFASRSMARGAQPFKQRWGGFIQNVEPAGSDSFLLHMDQGVDIEAMASRIAADPDVEYVEPEYWYQATIRPNDQFYNRLYAFPRIAAEQAWDITTGNPNTLIAVVDTGVYAGHPDFGSNIVNGADFVNGDNDASDDEGHGTHTAGVIASVGNNSRGVAGVCWQCKVLAVKALNEQGGASSITVATGIRYAADRGARVINLSLGGENDSRLLHDAVQYANGRGALVVVAAGNAALEGNPVEYPAAYPEVIAVGATDENDGHAEFSNYGSYVDIAAPGVGIGSTLWAQGENEVYAAASGTSAAAPFVSGLAGLLLSLNPGLTNEDVRRILLRTVDDLGTPGRDDFFGAGRINAYRAVQAVAAPAPPPPTPTPPPTPPVVPTDGIQFPETNKILRGEFRRFWESNGGLPVFGFPITDEQVEQTPEGPFLVQYFERNRFEFHPEKQPPYNVLLGRLGDTMLRRFGVDWTTLPKGQQTNGCQFFPATGHSLCEPFLSYWRTHGLAINTTPGFSADESLALFGLPLTEPRMETNSSGDSVMTQWFERARFEDHGAGRGVLLGLLGNEVGTTPAAPQPITPPQPVPAPPPSTPPPPAASACPDIPPSKDARVQPSPCMQLGVEMSMDVFGFAPSEEIAFWLTAPTGEVFGSTQMITAGRDGALSGLGFPTGVLGPGRWFWVFQGKQSGHQSIVYFHLYLP